MTKLFFLNKFACNAEISKNKKRVTECAFSLYSRIIADKYDILTFPYQY